MVSTWIQNFSFRGLDKLFFGIFSVDHLAFSRVWVCSTLWVDAYCSGSLLMFPAKTLPQILNVLIGGNCAATLDGFSSGHALDVLGVHLVCLNVS